jgi:c-di-GMP-binding flagellar brake protein YcgR
LYHLQRREDYRIHIPSSYKALLEVNSINSQIRKLSIPIMDLSGGGCRIQVEPKVLSLKAQDQIKGHIFLPDRQPIQIVGTVRHIRIEKNSKGQPICGIQFIGMSDITKNKIIAVVMDLYRELFVGRT